MTKWETFVIAVFAFAIGISVAFWSDDDMALSIGCAHRDSNGNIHWNGNMKP